MRLRLRLMRFVWWQHRWCWLRKDAGSTILKCLDHGDELEVSALTRKG